MEFLKLKIRNFLTIGDAPEIGLSGKGLVLIQGVNEDDTSATSNGVGKSSIADALCWAIYGSTARDESGDAVVNSTAKKDCFVRVLMRDGMTLYRITRYRKHKEFKNQTVVEVGTDPESVWTDASKGTEKETQEFINSIMGCSLDVFMAAIYAGQEVTPDLPKMTDKQLKLLIEEAAGVERLETAYEVARNKLNAAKAAHLTAVNTKTTVMAQIEGAKVDLAKKQIEAEQFEKGREERARVFKMNADAHKTVLVRYLTDMKGVDTDALNKRNAELGTALAEHSAKLRRRDEIKTCLSDTQRHLDRAQVALDTLTKEALKRKFDLENAEVEAKKACPTCGRSGDEHDVEEYKTHVKAKLVELAGKIREQKRNVEDMQERVAGVKHALDDYEAALPDVSELTREQAEINTKLRKYADDKFEASKCKSQMERQMELSASAATEPNPHASAISMVEERLEKLKTALSDGEKKCLECEDSVALFENVAKVFGPAGVRAHILDTVTPFLNDRTADYLSALSDGNISAVWSTLSTTAKGDTKEKFNIEVENDKGGKSFKLLSGGEKRKVRLATMLALQDLVASRATKPINLWIGDEIDDALDPAGLERLMGILERKARERGTVLVISHNDLNCWIDQAMTVTKRDGLSTISGALVE